MKQLAKERIGERISLLCILLIFTTPLTPSRSVAALARLGVTSFLSVLKQML